MTLRIAGALGALNARRADDLASRKQSDIILNPTDISGKTSAARLLHTTLGGVIRNITNADLVAFSKSAKALGAKMREGLTAQEIVDLSRQADRERARKEIHASLVTRLHRGEVLFTTGSGPDSKVPRHFVTVAFPGYGAAVSYPGTALQAAAELVKAPLKFDCDCEHHRYRFRYITTLMGANAGRPESGFCKLSNPTLTGIACKHTLRAMVELQGSMFVRKQIAKMIQADRDRLTPGAKTTRVITTSRAQADKALQSKVRSIKTTDEKHIKVIAASLKKANAGTPGASEINKTIAELQTRRDVPAKAILQALQAVMQQYPTGK